MSRIKVEEKDFEACKAIMASKKGIEESKPYTLFIKGTKGGFYEMIVEVLYDSTSGCAVIPIGESDMILLGKEKYGDEWYLLK